MRAESRSVSGVNPSYRFQHIPELDGLRGLAVLLVFLHHVLFTSIAAEHWPRLVQWARAASQYGANGVDVFFVLSGFLITSLMFVERHKPFYLRNFYWKRVLRIAPPLVLTLALVAAFNPAARGYVVLSLLFVVNYANLFHVSRLEGPFWTLAIEEQFYLAWPQIGRRLSVARLAQIALGIVIATPILRLLAARTAHHDYFQTQFRVDGLALGAFLACQVYRWRSAGAAVDLPVRGKRSAVPALAAGFVLIAGSIAGKPAAFFVGDTANALVISGVGLLTYSVIAFAVAYPFSAALSFFRAKVMVFLGDVSYCFYLSHLYLLRLYDHWFGPPRVGDTVALGVRVLSVLAATLAVSVLARAVVERPAFRLRRFVLAKPQTANIAAPVK